MDIITASAFQSMVENGLRNLKAHHQEVNDLNVFPVPDGDTGTNMTATLKGGVEAMERVCSDSLSEKASALASGMLLSARGNSGVILSQFFAGIGQAFSGLEQAGVAELSQAFLKGTETAYKAVVEPVEGTILTVAREGSEALASEANEIKTIEEALSLVVKKMASALQNTPNLLSVLKEAGVIDSGGAGLVYIIDGMRKDLLGEKIEDSSFISPSNVSSVDASAFNEDSELTYGYCTEFILQLQNCKKGPEKFDLDDMIKTFSSFGDSIVALRQGNIVKVHIHTKTPALAIEYAQRYGEFLTFKMENMNLQHNEILLKEVVGEKSPRKDIAIVAVAPSPEIAELFKSLKADQIVSGGQSMNPSADDFVRAFQAANADHILVFPNNGNVILTAKQAAGLYEGSYIIVLPTKSIVQAYSALQMLDFESESLEQSVETAKQAIDSVLFGEVSTSIRDSLNNGVQVKKGDAIGILGGNLVDDEADPVSCLLTTIEKVPDLDERSVITVFFGKGVSEQTKAEVGEKIQKKFPLMDYFPLEGGQDVYPFLFALE